jgi:Putative peptidoglycan binding domain.
MQATNTEPNQFFKIIRRPWVQLCLISFSVVVMVLSVVSLPYLFFQNRIYPGVSVAGLSLDGLTTVEAHTFIEDQIATFLEDETLIIDVSSSEATSSTFPLNLSSIDLNYDADAVTLAALNASSQFCWSQRLLQLWRLQKQSLPVPLLYEYDQEKLTSFIENIATTIDNPGAQPRISLNPETQSIDLSNGTQGRVLDKNHLEQAVLTGLAKLQSTPVTAVLDQQDFQVSQSTLIQAQKRAETLTTQSVSLEVSQLHQSWELSSADILSSMQ